MRLIRTSSQPGIRESHRSRRAGVFEFRRRKSSGYVARERLKLLLVSDRAMCSPEVMEMIRDDIIRVISRYLEIDVNGMDIQIAQVSSENGRDKTPVLFANIPIIQRIC